MESLKLFFSYGHEAKNSIIVDMIKARLENEHHHEVWFDRESIPASENWRRKIHDGIESSDRVVSFMSEHAMRTENDTPGVCIDELSIALSIPEMTIITILLEAPEKVKAPSTLTAVQWLDMSDWAEKYKIGGEVFESYFDAKFALILSAVENEKNFYFHGEVEGLRKSLLPDTGRERCAELLQKPMIGREWLEKNFRSYIKDRNADRFYFIFGGPGFGKSHFAAHAFHYDPSVLAAYFFEWNRQNDYSVNEFVRSVAFQMATRLPEFRSALIRKLKAHGLYVSGDSDIRRTESNAEWFRTKTDADLFGFLISDIPLIDGSSDNYLLVIDAADEAEYNGRNPLIDLLCSKAAARLPKWIKILVTARSEDYIRHMLSSQKGYEIDLDCVQSKEDIEKYLNYRLEKYIESGEIPPETVEKITQRCECTFIFAEKLCDAFETDRSVFFDLSRLPTNINGLYFTYFRRLFADSDYEKTLMPLSVLAANGGEIPTRLMMGIMEWSENEAAKFTDTMHSFVKETLRGKEYILAFCHKTVGEWLADRHASGVYAADIKKGRALTLDFCERCLDATDESDFSWGFNGSITPFPFETLGFVFDKITQFGTGKLKSRLNTDLKFLYDLQLEAYRSSKLKFADETAELIERNFSLLTANEKAEKEKYLAGSTVLKAETELARSGNSALTMFLSTEEKYLDLLKTIPALYGSTERNICFLLRKKNLPAAKERLDALADFLSGKNYPEKFSDMAQYNYHLSVILYDMGDYAGCEKTAKEAITLAEQYNEDPGRLSLMAYNQLGSCYNMLYRQSTGEDRKKYLDLQFAAKENSLKDRIETYGEYSRYTALGYDYMARAILDKSREKGEPLPPEAAKNSDKAMNISSYVLGSESALFARTLVTKALLLEYSGDYRAALGYAERAVNIYREYGESESVAAERTEIIRSRIAEYAAAAAT